MEKFVSEREEDRHATHGSELLQCMPRNRAGEAATARHGGAMLAAGTMGIGMVLSGILAFSGMPVFFPAAGFIFFLVAGYVVKLAGEIHARHIEDAQENEEREWSLRRDIDRERRNYIQVRERRRLEIERNLREEQRRQEIEETQKRRQDDLTKFVKGKENAAKQFLGQYSIPVRNVSVVGRCKAVIEIPFHKAPVHWQVIDLAEAALGLRVSIVPVRFCDKCGVKLSGPMVAAPTCFSCHSQLEEEGLTEIPVSGPSPQPLKPVIPYLPPKLHRFLKPPLGIVQQTAALTTPPTPNTPFATASIDIQTAGVGAEAFETNLLTQLSEQEAALEEADWLERMDLERNVPQIQARLDGRNENGKHAAKQATKKKTEETPPAENGSTTDKRELNEPSAAKLPNGELQPSEADHPHSIADELLERKIPEAPEPEMTVDRQGSVEIGATVIVRTGPFKDNIGIVSIVNKKKRSAKVQLKGFNTAVNLPLDFLFPTKPIEV